ncbi:MAG: pseudouridine synthase, partial [Pyrinomonadaceae bacterium]
MIIDKPAGLSSHDVIARARRILRTKRIGHTGTLDPFATGVLVLLIGNATRLAQFVNTDEKEYLAVARCGFATDSGDLTGTALEPRNEYRPVNDGGFTPEQLEQALA